MKRMETIIAAIQVATSIEAHLTGAVASISQRNQGVSILQKFNDFSFSVFKAKAFRFCLFFYRDLISSGRDCFLFFHTNLFASNDAHWFYRYKAGSAMDSSCLRTVPRLSPWDVIGSSSLQNDRSKSKIFR